MHHFSIYLTVVFGRDGCRVTHDGCRVTRYIMFEMSNGDSKTKIVSGYLLDLNNAARFATMDCHFTYSTLDPVEVVVAVVI